MAPTQYSTRQKHLHWAVVILLLLQYTIFEGMGRWLHALSEGEPAYNFTSIGHIAIGIMLLGLMLRRLQLRFTHGAPGPVEGEPALFQKLGHIAHFALYGLMIGMPIGGLVAWFGGIDIAARAHEIGAIALKYLVFAHVGAVLIHQFYWKTNLIRRMV